MLEHLVGMDVYLIDQLLKGRYQSGQKILDAGCGGGRNMNWFLHHDFEVYGIDLNEEVILSMEERYPTPGEKRWIQSGVESIPFPDQFFDHIICVAVLHFARNQEEFKQMFAELLRVLKPGGSMYMRVASIMGVEEIVKPLGDGVYYLPDDSNRFLLTRPLFNELIQLHNLTLLETPKWVVVEGMRSMSALVFQK